MTLTLPRFRRGLRAQLAAQGRQIRDLTVAMDDTLDRLMATAGPYAGAALVATGPVTHHQWSPSRWPCHYRGRLTPAEAHTLMQEHLECDCAARRTARAVLIGAGRMRPDSHRAESYR
ncbi:hypothetical protein [Nocardia sp. CC201C]|uniref:hypothetical protein n=1 Tax=Nocardia sp. CC201C TaxID=3044575 RepID=UPI0024A9D78B|nr:hypothetical protein [Nocardia sp. CC201C]